MKKLFPASTNSRGFALVVTLSLMILLTLVAVGLLSLSAASIRTSSQAKAEAEAKANARLALMFALGELQKQMGPDQRISANSNIVSTETVPNPNWTGVWDSWIAGAQGSAPVNPNYPSAYNSAHQTIGSQADPRLRPNYQQKSRHFRSWLLSLDPEQDTNIFAPMGDALQGKSTPQTGDSAVKLVGQGSLGTSSDPKDHVSASLLSLKTPTGTTTSGRYAWWVGDESQKARVMDDSYLITPAANTAEKIYRSQAPASTGTSTIKGLENLTNDGQLASLPSLASLDLLSGATGRPAIQNFHSVTPYSYSVLADVREGGLKRDLSTILERTIDPAEVYNFTYVEEFQRPTSYKPGGESFMLYEFDSLLNSISPTGQASVPIQDLAAYYQLYDNYRPGWKGGIQYSSNDSSPSNSQLTNGIMVSNPDYGSTSADFDKYLRQHSAQYRNVVPVKVEVILNYVTVPRPQADIDRDTANNISNPDTHELRIGFTPAMTFWNPNNVPVVMNIGNPQIHSLFMRETPIPLTFTFKKSLTRDGPPTQEVKIGMNQVTNTQQGELYTLYLSGNYPAKFEPGESKVFSLQYTSNTDAASGYTQVDFMNRGANINEDFFPEMELVPGWNPVKFVRPIPGRYAGRARAQDVILTFKETDYISTDVNSGTYNSFGFASLYTGRQRRNATPAMYHHRYFQTTSRISAGATYRDNFVYMGFPRVGRGGIASTSPRTIQIAPRAASNLITAMGNPTDLKDDTPETFFYYSWKAATETHEAGAAGSGRRFPSRPFLHSSPMHPPFFDSLSGASLYNYGWNWFFMPLDNLNAAPISISSGNSGYYGGGYTAANGTTHVVQQQLPLTPTISIAGLSSARLGGYGIGTEAVAAGYNGLQNPAATEAYRRVTATGWGGLAPAAQQAIGNSYAHPNIPAGKAFTTWTRNFVEGSNTATPFADHSYLANKALWDDFFFSSIVPKRARVKVFNGSDRSAKETAQDFFFNNKPLPNRRMQPYADGLDQAKFNTLLSDSEYSAFTNGFADKIAAYLMVEGSFNINSTSVDAWKALFSSLKGKPVAYLDKDTSLAGGVDLKQDQPDGVPVAAGDVPNAASHADSPSDPADKEQWFGWRELTDDEVEELAKAMVRQVKKRGPFLSLSEFVNRRLDSADPELSVKGALQAAIDDPEIPADKAINRGFRANKRKFTADEKTFVGAVFPEAMEGAIAYGSPAYVDQADILRNMAEQITPRGDTFVIRTYGDSVDASGKVAARVWCEAVVQRVPEYVDPTDADHVKQSSLTSVHNKKFGRKLQLVSFRWLNATEV